jgi:hypothetical protein
VRAGGIVPTQPELATTPAGPPRKLVINAQRGNGAATIYDDSGRGFAYERGRSARTTIRQRRSRGRTVLTIARTRGRFPSQPAKRRYEIRLAGVDRPRRVTVAGRPAARWRYRAARRTVVVKLGARPLQRKLRVVIG